MKQSGFSFVELIVVFGIVATFTALVSINLLGVQHGSSIAGTKEQLLADIAHVRLQSLSGFNASQTAGSAHGVHLDSDRYTLFTGSSYNPSNTANSVFILPQNITITDITLPGGTVVFATASGEIIGYSAIANSFAILEINSQLKKTIQFNALGTVISNE